MRLHKFFFRHSATKAVQEKVQISHAPVPVLCISRYTSFPRRTCMYKYNPYTCIHTYIHETSRATPHRRQPPPAVSNSPKPATRAHARGHLRRPSPVGCSRHGGVCVPQNGRPQPFFSSFLSPAPAIHPSATSCDEHISISCERCAKSGVRGNGEVIMSSRSEGVKCNGVIPVDVYNLCGMLLRCLPLFHHSSGKLRLNFLLPLELSYFCFHNSRPSRRQKNVRLNWR